MAAAFKLDQQSANAAGRAGSGIRGKARETHHNAGVNKADSVAVSTGVT